MRAQEVNYEAVAKVAELLKQEGKEPSLTNVSDALGIVTLTPELSSLLEKWYKSQPEFQRSKQLPLSNNLEIMTSTEAAKNLELEKSLSLLRATLESTADGIMMVNGRGQVIDWNQKFVEMWRIPSHMLESGTEKIGFEYILSQVSDPSVLIADVEFLYKNPDWQGELPPLHFKDGRIFARFTQPQYVGNEIVGRVYSFRDVTEKYLAEDILRIRERAIEASPHGVAIIDISKSTLPIIYVNKAFERITGHNEKDILGQGLSFMRDRKGDEVNHKRIRMAIQDGREEIVALESARPDGTTFWCELSLAPVMDVKTQVTHYVCILNDITQRREMEKQLLKQATHDALTDLPNRVLLIDRVEQAIIQARKKNSLVALLFIDLDRFKMINDTLGHTVGDKLLQVISSRLISSTYDTDSVARLGGDEFVIVLQDLSQNEQAEAVAKRLLSSIERPVQIGLHNLRVTASIGISYYPKDGVDYESLMKNADVSMYHAKDDGRNNYRIYTEEMNKHVTTRMRLDNALRDALKHNEFYLVYQPLIDLKKNCGTGFEALIRWHSQTLGYVSPLDFISMAEENGLIVDIGTWVLEQACRQLVNWHKQGYAEFRVAVNISGRQFRQTRLADVVEKILHKTGLPPRFLELELTESLLVDDVKNAVEIMYQLKDMGVHLVIDDFGTGYSSLSYLKQFPVDKLKIDRSFISELTSLHRDAPIARAIINLGHSLNLSVLAEGIETELHKNFIIKHDCDFAQGYYYQPPKKPEELQDFLIKFPNH